jgi:hypothetical protein
MSMQRLHLSASLCEKCKGPVVSGWLGVREGEITKEIEVRRFGGVCLACGNRQDKVDDADIVRHAPPVEWE